MAISTGRKVVIGVATTLLLATVLVVVLDALDLIYIDSVFYNERSKGNPSASVNTTAETMPEIDEVLDFDISPESEDGPSPDLKSNVIAPSSGDAASDRSATAIQGKDSDAGSRSLLHHGTCPGWHAGTKYGTVFLSIRFVVNGANQWYECTGTSIGGRRIMTAAHCVTKHEANGSYIWASEIIVTDIYGNNWHVDERTLRAFNGFVLRAYVSHDVAWFKTWSQVGYNTGVKIATQSGWKLFVAYMFNHQTNKVYDYSWGRYETGQKCPGNAVYQAFCGPYNYKNIVTSINVVGGNSGSGVYEYDSTGRILGISGAVSVGSCSTMQAGTLTSGMWTEILNH